LPIIIEVLFILPPKSKMKKVLLTIAILWPAGGALHAWWDAGHLITAMIAYQNLDAPVRARVDALTLELQRDYPFINHFIATGPWPDDLKADGVRAYDTWHYTNIPYNRDGVALPPRPEVDIIWAINQSMAVLRAEKAQDAEKARFLAFLVHFVSDLHQPLHSTSMFTHEQPGGNAGGTASPSKATGATCTHFGMMDAAIPAHLTISIPTVRKRNR
jgi:hypothetical protein